MKVEGVVLGCPKLGRRDELWRKGSGVPIGRSGTSIGWALSTRIGWDGLGGCSKRREGS